MKLRTFLAAICLSWPLLVSSVPPKGLRTISEVELKAHVEFLASPELAGRDAPGIGSQIAERYLATRFEEYGLSTMPGLTGYYQEVPLILCKTDYERSLMRVEQGNQKWEFKPNQEVFFFPRGGEDAELSGQVLLAGYGIRAPEFGYDDFANADPQGKFLLIFNREPQENDSTSRFNGAKATKYSNPMVKVRMARELGALGLLIIQPPNNGLPPIEETLERYRRSMNDPLVQLADEKDGFPVFYLKPEVARILLGDAFDLAAYQTQLDEKYCGRPLLLEGVNVTLNLRFKEVEHIATANIVGYLPGKSEEAVLLLAHHDHVGRSGDSTYFGADDNASGVAGLLGLAEAFSSLKAKLERGVIFLSTSAEEDGTLGALYFARHLPIPREKIVAAINMDEIGRDASSQFRAMQDPSLPIEKDMLMIFYSGQTPRLAEIAEKENRATELSLILEPVLHFSGSSDHIHFHDLQIPSMFVFTGFHPDYHSPRDSADKINYPKLARVARLVFGISYDLATIKPRPIFDTSITKVAGTGRKYGG